MIINQVVPGQEEETPNSLPKKTHFGRKLALNNDEVIAAPPAPSLMAVNCCTNGRATSPKSAGWAHVS